MNLKTFLDAANGAEARVQQIAAQIDGLFTEGKTTEALELKPQLDTAKADAKAKGEMYVAMLELSSSGNDPAQRFTHVDVTKNAEDQPFKNAGEFFKQVRLAAQYPGREDPRLKPLKNATGMSEGVPADGGYLVVPNFASGILERMYQTGQILSRVSQDPVTVGNDMTYNGVDEVSRASSLYGGVVPYVIGEGASITASKPAFRQVSLKLKKIAALCYATDEQLEDTPSLASWLGRNVPDALRFKCEDMIYEGIGGGQFTGIMGSPSLVSVLRIDANEIDATDISNMWSRRWAPYTDYVWLINQAIFPQLVNLVIGNWPVFLPAGGVSGAPYATIFGRPVIEVEYASALGTTGDIMLASLSQYQTITKGGVRAESSIHVAFATDETAFRFVYRMDGAPLWHDDLTPFKGSATQSPFVVLSSASA